MWEGDGVAKSADEGEAEGQDEQQDADADDDDDFGDDFDEFAEGGEDDADFGDFDEADETPLQQGQPKPSAVSAAPDILAGLVSSLKHHTTISTLFSTVPSNPKLTFHPSSSHP